MKKGHSFADYICSDSHAPGYYMAHTPEEKAPFIADIRSRIKELSEILEKMGV